MGHFEPQTVTQLASVIEDIFRALQIGGEPLSESLKQALTNRVVELYESGITGPDELRLGVIADRLWRSGQLVLLREHRRH
jgi:hypothetical protein